MMDAMTSSQANVIIALLLIIVGFLCHADRVFHGLTVWFLPLGLLFVFLALADQYLEDEEDS